MTQRERADTKVEAMLYRAVVQAMIMFCLESCILSKAMERTVEGTHTRFLQQIMGNRVRWNTNRTWVTLDEEEVR